MSDSTSASPALSPGFERARRLSGMLRLLLTIGFWLTALSLLAAPAILLIRHAIKFSLDGITIHVAPADWPDHALIALAVLLAAVPLLFVLHLARGVFGKFARGEVFAEGTIARIRQAAIWLIVAALATTAAENLLDLAAGVQPTFPPSHHLRVSWLIFGAVTYVAAHVMAEARRMGNENAGFF